MAGLSNSHVRVKLTQCFVEIVHLRDNANNDDNAKDISAGRGELVISTKGQFDCNAKALDSHDRHATSSAADAEID